MKIPEQLTVLPNEDVGPIWATFKWRSLVREERLVVNRAGLDLCWVGDIGDFDIDAEANESTITVSGRNERSVVSLIGWDYASPS